VIGPTDAVRVMVATKPVDFPNYVERRIMRSPGPGDEYGFVKSMCCC
jgi:hypothetical protein